MGGEQRAMRKDKGRNAFLADLASTTILSLVSMTPYHIIAATGVRPMSWSSTPHPCTRIARPSKRTPRSLSLPWCAHIWVWGRDIWCSVPVGPAQLQEPPCLFLGLLRRPKIAWSLLCGSSFSIVEITHVVSTTCYVFSTVSQHVISHLPTCSTVSQQFLNSFSTASQQLLNIFSTCSQHFASTMFPAISQQPPLLNQSCQASQPPPQHH